MNLFEKQLSGKLRGLIEMDFKSRLQELTQSLYKEAPGYEVVGKEGPDHNLKFEVVVSFRGQTLGRGTGLSKKSASQAAASEALVAVNNNPEMLSGALS